VCRIIFYDQPEIYCTDFSLQLVHFANVQHALNTGVATPYNWYYEVCMHAACDGLCTATTLCKLHLLLHCARTLPALHCTYTNTHSQLHGNTPKGTLLACLPCLIVSMWIWLWFAESGPFSSSDPINKPSAVNFEGISGSWQVCTRMHAATALSYAYIL
jgi:hypothetical protein